MKDNYRVLKPLDVLKLKIVIREFAKAAQAEQATNVIKVDFKARSSCKPR